jgi:flagellar FliL protein
VVLSLELDRGESMVDDGEEYDKDEDDEGGGGGSKKLLVIVGLALFLVVGGSAAAYFTGLLQPVIDMISGGYEAPAEGTENDADVTSGESYFKSMEDLIVNLNTGGKKSVFLNMKVSLELSSQADGDKVELLMPRVTDYFQVYLRELRVEDLKGSAGMYRLREELLARVRAAVAPIQVRDVLFKQILIQ